MKEIAEIDRHCDIAFQTSLSITRMCHNYPLKNTEEWLSGLPVSFFFFSNVEKCLWRRSLTLPFLGFLFLVTSKIPEKTKPFLGRRRRN